ncbi:MAG: T9SS type A sorting domain-containing protein, partial [Bacteroidota bacterium]
LNWKSVEGVQAYDYEVDVLNTFDSPALIAGTKNYIDASPKNEDTEFQATGLDNGATYFWRVRARDANGNLTAWSDTWSFTISENGVSVEETLQARLGWQLFPNPAEGPATVAFTLQEPGNVRMVLSDLLGRELDVLATGHRSAGAHQIMFDSDHYPAGVYFIRTEMAGESFTRKVVVR